MFEGMHQPAAVTMIARTSKIRRGDVIVQQVPDKENPYREVRLTETPVNGEILYQGRWIPVKYFTGEDVRNRKRVMYTGTEFQTWQIVRETSLFVR
jgi:hypothetical protein